MEGTIFLTQHRLISVANAPTPRLCASNLHTPTLHSNPTPSHCRLSSISIPLKQVSEEAYRTPLFGLLGEQLIRCHHLHSNANPSSPQVRIL